MTTTEAWVLPARAETDNEFAVREYSLPEMKSTDALVRPLFGCWEGNIGHAIDRDPVDIVAQRGESKVVLGNSGVVEVVRVGDEVSDLKAGDLCLFAPFGHTDRYGYIESVHAYDAPHTMGIMAKQSVLPASTLFPIPDASQKDLAQWAVVGRYWSSFNNWNVTKACWQAQMRIDPNDPPFVLGWGGGVVLGELQLAARDGFVPAMAASSDTRLELIRSLGIHAIDRREYPTLGVPDEQLETRGLCVGDRKRDEGSFAELIADLSGGRGADIVLDNIGGSLHRTSLHVLARQGVLSTVGWKSGMRVSSMRAIECIKRHVHVHTHAFTREDVLECMKLHVDGWMPPAGDVVGGFEDIGRIASDYSAGLVDSYFPVYTINTASENNSAFAKQQASQSERESVMDEKFIAADICEFIDTKILKTAGGEATVTAETPLLEKGVLNSLGTMNLVAHIKERFGIKVPVTKIVGANFKTANHIAAMVVDLSDQQNAPSNALAGANNE